MLGIDPLVVGEYTPYELTLISKAKAERDQRTFEDDLCLAWHVEAFARQKRAEKRKKRFLEMHEKNEYVNQGEYAV